MLKVSGEALAGENGFGIDPDVVHRIAREVAEASMAGVQVAVVVGGGVPWRRHRGVYQCGKTPSPTIGHDC